MSKTFFVACAASLVAGFCLFVAVLLTTDGGKQSILDGWMPAKLAILILCMLVGIGLPICTIVAMQK